MNSSPSDNQPLPQWQQLFVGRDQELNFLKQKWQLVEEGCGTEICLLVGESGLGKTRLIQEFYSWISSSERYDPTNYWPDTLKQLGDNLEVNPKFEDNEASGELPWLWWGVRWHNPAERNRQEAEPCQMVNDYLRLQPHKSTLERSLQALHYSKEVIKNLLDMVLGQASTSFHLGKIIWDIFKHDKDLQAPIHERHAQNIESQAGEVLKFFTLLLSKRSEIVKTLPIILILDDIQWCDPLSIKLILQPLIANAKKNHWPLLVISTIWEKELYLAEENSNTSLISIFKNILKPHEYERAKILLGNIKGLDQVIQSAYPGLTQGQGQQITAKCDGNALLVQEVVLWLQRRPHFFIDNDFGAALTETGLRHLEKKSFNLHDFQEERFGSMDSEYKLLLGAGSAQGMQFIGTLLNEVMEQVVQLGAQNSQEILIKSIRPHALISKTGRSQYIFRHRLFYEVAHQFLKEEMPETWKQVQHELLHRGMEWLQENREDELTFNQRESLYFLLIGLLNSNTSQQFAEPRLPLTKLLIDYTEMGYTEKAKDLLESAKNEHIFSIPIELDTLSYTKQENLFSLAYELNEFEECQKFVNGFRNQIDEKSFQNDVLLILNSSLSMLEGNLLAAQDKPGEALALYQCSLLTRERILLEFGETEERLRDVSVSQDKVAGVLHLQDKPGEALALYQRSLLTCERILLEFGETAERLRDVSVSQCSVADVLFAQDKPGEALALYQRSLLTNERILQEYGETAERLRDVSVSQGRVGNVLFAQDKPGEALALYQRSLLTRERILLEFGETAERLRDVPTCQDRVADVLLTQDKSGEALALYQRSLLTRERILQEYGETAERLRDVSLSQVRVADVLFAQDKPGEALALYQRSLLTNERILQEYGETAERLRDVSVSQGRVGNVLFAQDKPGEALALYQRSLLTNERILQEYGETAERLRDVSISQGRVGDVLFAQDKPGEALALYQRSLLTNECILQEYGETAERLRDVSLSQDNVADVLLAQDKPGEALALYQCSLLTRERILLEFGETAERLRDVSVSQDKVAGVLHLQDKPGEALALYQRSLLTCERILLEFGETAERLRDLMVLYNKLASLDINSKSSHINAAITAQKQLIEHFGDTKQRLDELAYLNSQIEDQPPKPSN